MAEGCGPRKAFRFCPPYAQCVFLPLPTITLAVFLIRAFMPKDSPILLRGPSVGRSCPRRQEGTSWDSFLSRARRKAAPAGDLLSALRSCSTFPAIVAPVDLGARHQNVIVTYPDMRVSIEKSRMLGYQLFEILEF